MSPAKVSKKKRGGGGAATSTTTSVKGATQYGSSSVGATVNGSGRAHASLQEALAFFDRLAHDSKTLAFRSDGILWLHQAVATVVVNAVMYDLDVGRSQLIVLFLSCLWLGRRFILHHFLYIDPRPSHWKKFVAWRLLMLAGFIGPALLVNSTTVGTTTEPSAFIIVLAALDSGSMVMNLIAKESKATKLLQMSDTLFTIGLFSTQYNQRPYLIYDHRTIALTLVTVVVEWYIVEGAQDSMYNAPWMSDAQVLRNQQQRRKTVDTIRRSLSESADDGVLPIQPSVQEADDLSQEELRWPIIFASISHTIRAMKEDARGQIALWIAFQALYVLLQVVCSLWVVFAWELWSFVMVTSIHLLLELLRLRRLLDRESTWLTHAKLGLPQ